jgi:hypothetical protein
MQENRTSSNFLDVNLRISDMVDGTAVVRLCLFLEVASSIPFSESIHLIHFFNDSFTAFE